jgi:hypothetical protein
MLVGKLRDLCVVVAHRRIVTPTNEIDNAIWDLSTYELGNKEGLN